MCNIYRAVTGSVGRIWWICLIPQEFKGLTIYKKAIPENCHCYKNAKSYCASGGFNLTFLKPNFATHFLHLSWDTGCYNGLSENWLSITELNHKSSSPLIEATATDHTPEELLFDAVGEAEFHHGTRQISALFLKKANAKRQAPSDRRNAVASIAKDAPIRLNQSIGADHLTS